MAGCGGCGPEGCNGPCSRRTNNPEVCGKDGCKSPSYQQPRNAVSLSEALAKVIVDNRTVRFTMDYIAKFPNATADEVVVAYTLAKEDGRVL